MLQNPMSMYWRTQGQSLRANGERRTRGLGRAPNVVQRQGPLPWGMKAPWSSTRFCICTTWRVAQFVLKSVFLQNKNFSRTLTRGISQCMDAV